MKYLVPVSLVILLFACQLHQKPGAISDEKVRFEKDSLLPAPPTDSLQAVTFYDSILQKQQLSFAQIRAHTSIDSFYYTGNYNGQSTFTGDTVYVLRNNFKGVVIEHSGPNCLKNSCLFLIQPTGSCVMSKYTAHVIVKKTIITATQDETFHAKGF